MFSTALGVGLQAQSALLTQYLTYKAESLRLGLTWEIPECPFVALLSQGSRSVILPPHSAGLSNPSPFVVICILTYVYIHMYLSIATM